MSDEENAGGCVVIVVILTGAGLLFGIKGIGAALLMLGILALLGSSS